MSENHAKPLFLKDYSKILRHPKFVKEQEQCDKTEPCGISQKLVEHIDPKLNRWLSKGIDSSYV